MGDIELLHSLFGEVDVHWILQIPLHRLGFEDFITWDATKHGRYTVRSGYYLQWRHKFGASTSQLALPGQSAINPVWKSLWQMKILSKVKIFIWRALHGSLPLKSILYNIHIGTTGAALFVTKVRRTLIIYYSNVKRHKVFRRAWASLKSLLRRFIC
jgi:hypothetical protein